MRNRRSFFVLSSATLAFCAISPLSMRGQGRFISADWPRVQAIVGKIHGISTAPPTGLVTTKYTSGALLGNGDIGIAVGDTDAARQRFWFGKSDFWGTHWNARHKAPEVSILSLGSLVLSSAQKQPDSGSVYKVDQDILHAEVTSTLKFGKSLVRLRSWTADGENVFVTEAMCDPHSSEPARIQVRLDMPPADDSPHTTYPVKVGSLRGVLWASRENNLSRPNDYQARAAIAVRVLGGDPVESTSPAQPSGFFTLKPAGHAWIITVFKSDARIGADGPSPEALVRSATRAANALTPARIKVLYAAHEAWWRHFWTRSYIEIHDAVLENYYYGALYVLGSSSRPGKLAPSLWGNFITTDDAGWGGRYFMNYNEEAPYYGVFSSNHPELAEPYNHMVLAQMPFQRNRTAEAGYKGVSFQRTFSPFTVVAHPPAPVPVAPEKNYRKLPSDQKSNATFSLLPTIQYYEYTQDRDFLRNALYPAMKQLDAFWRDFAVRDASGKHWVFEHSSAHEGGDDENPNLDIGFARRIEDELLQTSEILGVDASMRPVWQSFRDELAPYPTAQVNGKTVYTIASSVNNKIKDQGLFEPGDQPINLEGIVFPGENLAIGGNSRELQIARDSMLEMNSWGVTRGGNSHNGFCKIFPIAARIGWPADDLLQKLKAAILYQWRPSNLTVFQGGGGIETSGSVEALDSMLLQHENGMLRVFPDWPLAKDASFVRLRAKGAFLVSSKLETGQVVYIHLVSEKGGPLSVQSPWHTGNIRCQGCATPLLPVNDGRFVINTVRGGRYRISPSENVKTENHIAGR